MAINILTDPLFVNRHEGTSSDFPWGSFRDDPSNGNTGSPVARAHVWNNHEGFFQRLLTAGKVTPSGDVETATDSDYFECLQKMYGGERTVYNPSATNVDKYARGYTIQSYDSLSQYSPQGTDYKARVSMHRGGLRYSGTAPGDEIVSRDAEFNIDTNDLSVESFTTDTATRYLIVFNSPEPETDLVGIPKGAKIHGVRLETRSDGGGTKGTDMSYTINYSGVTHPRLTIAIGNWSSPTFHTGEARLIVSYDPSDLD